MSEHQFMELAHDVGARFEEAVEDVFYILTEKSRPLDLEPGNGDYIFSFDVFPEAVARCAEEGLSCLIIVP